MIKIRKATLKDVPALVDMWKEFEDAHSAMVVKKKPVMKYLLKYKPNVKAVCRKSLRRTIKKIGFVFIAEEDKTIAGYIEGSIKNPELAANRIGSIWDLYVKKDYRGGKISSMLKDAAFSFFRKNKVKAIEMNVNRHNKNAYSIYKKWGFFEDGIRMIKIL
ncbi:MAG: GNAT family N-acetyltransferase [Nanoarchaeota archaeon]